MDTASEAKRHPGGTAELLARIWIHPLLLAFAAAFWVGISDLPPDAASYPRAVIVALAALLVTGFFADIRAWQKGRPDVPEGDDASSAERAPGFAAFLGYWRKSVAAFVLTAGYVWLIPRAGYYEATVPYLVLMFLALGLRRPVQLVALTVGVLLVSYLLFDVILNVLVPRGPIFG